MSNMMNILLAEISDAEAQTSRAITAIARAAHTLSLVLEDEGATPATEPLSHMFEAAKKASEAKAELLRAAALIRAADSLISGNSDHSALPARISVA